MKTVNRLRHKKGRGGSERTTELISSTVKSLKVIDLKDAGLVTGAEDDNDICDLRRSKPTEWVSLLRSVIDATECMDLTANASQAATEAFLALYEDDGAYWAPGQGKE